MSQNQPSLTIWIDADACPRPIKEILYRASERKRIPLIMVANVPMRPPASSLIQTLLVAAGPDIADQAIAERVQPGDLVISADIPLANDVIAKGAFCLDPRGKMHNADNIHERLSMRNLMDELRGSRDNFGENLGGPPPFHPRDRQAFANALESFFRQAGL